MVWLAHMTMMIREPVLAVRPMLVDCLELILCDVLSSCDAPDAAAVVASVHPSAAVGMVSLPLIHHYLREEQIAHHEHVIHHFLYHYRI